MNADFIQAGIRWRKKQPGLVRSSLWLTSLANLKANLRLPAVRVFIRVYSCSFASIRGYPWDDFLCCNNARFLRAMTVAARSSGQG